MIPGKERYKEEMFPIEPWQKIIREEILGNPWMTVDDFTEYFGAHHVGYFPTERDISTEIRKALSI